MICRFGKASRSHLFMSTKLLPNISWSYVGWLVELQNGQLVMVRDLPRYLEPRSDDEDNILAGTQRNLYRITANIFAGDWYASDAPAPDSLHSSAKCAFEPLAPSSVTCPLGHRHQGPSWVSPTTKHNESEILPVILLAWNSNGQLQKPRKYAVLKLKKM